MSCCLKKSPYNVVGVQSLGYSKLILDNDNYNKILESDKFLTY